MVDYAILREDDGLLPSTDHLASTMDSRHVHQVR
jgi:hypothetical protein